MAYLETFLYTLSSTSATNLSGDGTEVGSTRSMRIYNASVYPVYIGGSGVTAASGHAIPPRHHMYIGRFAGAGTVAEPPWAIGSVSGQKLRMQFHNP